MSEVLHQSAPTRKPTRPSKPPTNKKKLCKVHKKEVESLCEAFDAMAIEVLPPTVDTKEEEKKEIPGTVHVAEQTYQGGELWQLKAPATVDELMGQILDDSASGRPTTVRTPCKKHRQRALQMAKDAVLLRQPLLFETEQNCKQPWTHVFQLPEPQMFLLPMAGCSLEPQDPNLHPSETDSSPTTTSIPWLSTTHGGLPTKEEADRNAISISPVQAEWKISREDTPSMPPSAF